MDSGATAIRAPQTDVVSGRKRRDLIEFCVGYALVLLVIWTPRPWQRLSYAVAAAYLATVLWTSFAGWKAMGLQTANFARSIWVIGVALVSSAIAILVASRMHTLLLPGSPLLFLERYAGYTVGACIQQILLQNIFLPRLLQLIRTPASAALVAAAIFSLAHLPNPILTVATLIWGFAACLLFLRYRNLYTLAIAHAIFGIAIAMTVPGPVIHNMRVGLGYITYSPHLGHHRNH
jgi:membrane protease YdiL (CAAX protease family)